MSRRNGCQQLVNACRTVPQPRASRRRSGRIFLVCLLGSMIVLASSKAPVRAEGQFPRLFSYLLRRSPDDEKAIHVPVRAAGFSHDGKTLAVWFSNQVAILDGDTGMERGRVAGIRSSGGSSLPQITFDPTGQYCCIDNRVLVDVRHLAASEPFKSPVERDSFDYRFESTNFPLRPCLCIARADDDTTRANCKAVFPAKGDRPATTIAFYFSRPQLDAADRAYQAVADALKLKIESNERGGLIFGNTRILFFEDGRVDIPSLVEAVKKQVALSSDGKTLLTQRVREPDGTLLTYYFAFYDVPSRKRITEIRWPTEFYWRSHGNRGFAFAPDLGKVAVFGRRGGNLQVYDLSAIVTRKIENADSLPLWAFFGRGTQ